MTQFRSDTGPYTGPYTDPYTVDELEGLVDPVQADAGLVPDPPTVVLRPPVDHKPEQLLRRTHLKINTV